VLEVIEVDMNFLDSIKTSSARFICEVEQVHVADTPIDIMATPEGIKTIDGFEQQFRVNHLAHYTLTALLLPALISSSTLYFNSRVIALTSNGQGLQALG